MVKFDQDEIRVKLSAARDVHRRNSIRSGHVHLTNGSHGLANQRNYLDVLLASTLNNIGSDVDEFNVIRSQARLEIRDSLQEQKAAVAESSCPLRDDLRSDIASWRRTTERLVSLRNEAPALFNFNFVILDTPFWVFSSGGIDVPTILLAPWNNVAKVSGEWNNTGNDYLTFVFAWTNPSDFYAVINVESYLTLNGFCDVYAAWGLNSSWGHNISDLALDVELQLYLNDPNNPNPVPPFQMGQYQNAIVVNADGGGLFGLGDLESSGISGSYDVTYRNFLIPPKESVVFGVDLLMRYSMIEDGYSELDLASGNFEVVCPALVIAILTG